jgi:hypothetical protein
VGAFKTILLLMGKQKKSSSSLVVMVVGGGDAAHGNSGDNAVWYIVVGECDSSLVFTPNLVST